MSVTGPDVLCNALTLPRSVCRWRHKIRKIAVEILQSVNNRTHSLREKLHMVVIDIVINTLLGGLTLDPTGIHCPAWDEAFVSSYYCYYYISVMPLLMMIDVAVNYVKLARPCFHATQPTALSQRSRNVGILCLTHVVRPARPNSGKVTDLGKMCFCGVTPSSEKWVTLPLMPTENG